MLLLKEEKRFLSLIGYEIVATVARLVQVAIGLLSLLQFLIREDGPVHIEVNDVIVAHTMLRRFFLQVMMKGLVGAWAQDLDLHWNISLSQRLHHWTRNRAIAHILFAPRPCRHDQHIDGGRRLDFCLER